MNKALQQTLKDGREGKRNLWYYIKRTHGLNLILQDKVLIISQLKDYEDYSWDSLWKHTNLVLQQFGYLGKN